MAGTKEPEKFDKKSCLIILFFVAFLLAGIISSEWDDENGYQMNIDMIGKRN